MSLLTDSQPERLAAELVTALRAKFDTRWSIHLDGGRLAMRHRGSQVSPSRLRRVPHPTDLLDKIGAEFGRAAVTRPALLPLRWGRDTDLLISAVQGLDPWLKNAERRVHREGYIPQPVVRFTGERDDQGRLRDGFLTSFVNLSCVLRIASVDRHVDLMDSWISALSAVGIHAGRLTIHGDLTPWQRGPVGGVTLFCDCDGVGLSDAVLLWNAENPTYMASDIGSGLERVRWHLSPGSWATTVFGDDAELWSVDLLDAVRTAALMVMNGIRPSGRGPGHALRRVLQRIPPTMAASGLGRLVRAQRAYWDSVGVTGPAWPSITTVIEDGALCAGRRPRAPGRRSP
ncbi:hypothetical protein [Actinokineospora sp.]|uniref:hypothetical protein n=1 Tax=Actinokineospora sp. TaxID=1872133 RepID=UPI00403816A0